MNYAATMLPASSKSGHDARKELDGRGVVLHVSLFGADDFLQGFQNATILGFVFVRTAFVFHDLQIPCRIANVIHG